MNGFNFEYFGETEIYRPNFVSELSVRQEAEEHLRSSFGTGIYTARDDINSILQHQFNFYDLKMKQLLPQIASRYFMQFVLEQYDAASTVFWNVEKGVVSALDERQRWRDIGPDFRRAAKYLAECITMLVPTEEPKAEQDKLVELIDRCWIFAELMVHHSVLSSQTYALFPNDTTLEIRPVGEHDWFILRLNDWSRFEAFDRRIKQDTSLRKNVLDETTLIYNRQRVTDVLDNHFKNSLGFSALQALQFGLHLNANVEQPDSDIPFFPESECLNMITGTVGCSESQARCLLDGLVLRREKMIEEGRVVWKPKQEYRAYTRPFFEFQHPDGTHFIWSKKMAEECLMMLYTRFVQKHVPPEWSVGTVPNALEEYSAQITKQFELTTIECLDQLGIKSDTFKSSIGQGGSQLQIPESIGEIDVLGYRKAEGLLVVGECKLVKSAVEPATFRDDVSKFTDGNNCYVSQLNRKTEWVRHNAKSVATALQSLKKFPKSIEVKKIAPVLITFYPTFASLLFDDVPCVSLAEFNAEVKGSGQWPYQPTYAFSEDDNG
jgi:hypothetical protein